MNILELLNIYAITNLTVTQEKFWHELAKYRQRLYYLACGILRDADDAEDVVHETLIKAAKNFETFKKKSGIYTWLVRILINNCKDAKRRKNKTDNFSKKYKNKEENFNLQDLRENISEKIELSDESNRLMNIITKMGAKYRNIILLRYYDSMSYSDIADSLDISVGTVKSRLHEGRKILKKNIQELQRKGENFGL
ncbi:MAG: RNA polymerase sigma factor [Spirochaetia bacterium]|nr:RNA polymerase sigma factor [Spirochaetia bacterium]